MLLLFHIVMSLFNGYVEHGPDMLFLGSFILARAMCVHALDQKLAYSVLSLIYNEVILLRLINDDLYSQANVAMYHYYLHHNQD